MNRSYSLNSVCLKVISDKWVFRKIEIWIFEFLLCVFCIHFLRFNDKKLKRTTLNCSNVNFLKSCCLIYVSTLIFVYKYSLWKKKHNLYRMFDTTCRIHVHVQGQTQNVAQYSLHHMTCYAPAKFEAAIPNSLGGNAFTRNIWFDLGPTSRSHEALPSTSCDLCTCKVWNCYDKWLRRCITKKIHYLTLTQRSRVKVTQNIAQYPRLHVTYAPAKFDVATSHG